jgi:hypothetical protein
MGRATPGRAFRELSIYVLVAILALGPTIYPSMANPNPLEKRSDATSHSSTKAPVDSGAFSIWSSTDGSSDAKPSFLQNWLAQIYIRLLTVKSALQSVLVYAWHLGHTKPDNTCS